jgi:hypothetical protein
MIGFRVSDLQGRVYHEIDSIARFSLDPGFDCLRGPTHPNPNAISHPRPCSHAGFALAITASVTHRDNSFAHYVRAFSFGAAIFHPDFAFSGTHIHLFNRDLTSKGSYPHGDAPFHLTESADLPDCLE